MLYSNTSYQVYIAIIEHKISQVVFSSKAKMRIINRLKNRV